MKKHCIAMLLAGGQGSRLYALTAKVAKPSLPFGGKYRIIDFPLSNCANSGIDTVGVLTQYQPLLLNRYIGSGQAWDLDSIDGGVYILPPYQSAGERGSWFSGTANAIYQNMDFIEMYDPDCVLILSGDHVYKMDYDKMLRAHGQAGAACTISVIRLCSSSVTAPSGSVVRMVPHISALSGMTLDALPASNRPVVNTPNPAGSSSRLLISCRAMWMWAAAVMGSMQALGIEP